MNSSLEKLVKNLFSNDFKQKKNEEKLPDKECFYSSVIDGTTGDNGEKLDSHISNKDYLTDKKIWNEFNMKNMGDCHDHYLKKDVLLLTDVFEMFIGTCLKFYMLDRCHYFSSPGLSQYVILKMTCMRLFIEKGLRGGISFIAKR